MSHRPSQPRLAFLLTALLAWASSSAQAAENGSGLLFYLSADHGTTADLAAPGTAAPTFDTETSVVADGARGPAIACGDMQRLAWRAPGNIYAQRGTLSFHWRARYPVGPTAFPLFQVAYADHSSWDMTWLRIDYNGHGFDAFVTDASLARTRVSVRLPQRPKPDAWTQVTFTWDENQGIKLYLDGKLAAAKAVKPGTVRWDAALDQFGPHSRIISPYQVQSDYNFTRGGDIDELRIFDHALDSGTVAALAAGGQAPVATPAPLARAPWRHRHGWDHAAPPHYPGPALAVRKVEIHDAYDLKRWWWKATDGIRETTWPGVYNRSRLAGRNDYFQLPDWDAYVESGKAITFTLPDEAVNHIEIAGAAWGTMERLALGSAPARLFTRARGVEKTVHALAPEVRGGQLRFTNEKQEQPIGELAAYHVSAAAAPQGSRSLAFSLSGGTHSEDGIGDGIAPLADYIRGRFPAAERHTLVARPADAAPVPPAPSGVRSQLVHVLIPNTWDKLAATDGLDGIAIDLPAVAGKPGQGSAIPLNIRIKDPLWPLRDMLDFSFKVQPGEAKSLWFDTRDRILPVGKGIWISIAAGSDIDPAVLAGAQLRLVFKPRAHALAEHRIDRFTQARDSYAMLVEEHPRSPKLDLWVRFKGDLTDLLRVDPAHLLGLSYAAAAGIIAPAPAPALPAPPAGVPAWAWYQSQLLGRVTRFVDYYIDRRQVPYGDFGGGISDDSDLLNLWPGLALMGAQPDKIRRSNRALLEAAYRNGMFTRGLSTIQTDELHSYEEGINSLGQVMLLEHGSPRQLERAMETARAVRSITAINGAGHRHIRTSYYSGSVMATEAPWNTARPFSYLVMQPGQMLVDYNGSPDARRYMLELADGLMAHRPAAGTGSTKPVAIRFDDDAEIPTTRSFLPWHVYWGAYRWTGEERYLQPIIAAGAAALKNFAPNPLEALDLRKPGSDRLRAAAAGEPAQAKRTLAHLDWQLSGDKGKLAALYQAQIEEADRFEFINTEGSLWTDRVDTPSAELQRARLGGLALLRYAIYPDHVVSWRFAGLATAASVAILIPDASPTSFKVIAYNLDDKPVAASMTGWNIDPGLWEVSQGIDSDDDDVADTGLSTRTVPFERSRVLDLTLAPRSATVVKLKLNTPGTPYWSRQDLGIDREDVVRKGTALTVTVHSLGGIASRAGEVRLVSRAGAMLARASVPALAAPGDLLPKTAKVKLALPAGAGLHGARVELHAGAEEITALNDVVTLD